MTAEDLALTGLVALAGAGLGWLLTRRATGRRHAPHDEAFLRGLSQLLDDEPDRALETFERLAAADDAGSVELQFALGGLFRRRGELARATRIHAALATRGALAPGVRARARLELGEDYLQAGVLDRAEALLGDLARDAELGASALRGLVRLYEQQRDWGQAIRATEALTRLDRVARHVALAHYRCELAEAAAAHGDRRAARGRLDEALALDRQSVRARLLRAQLDEADGRPGAAARELEHALELDPERAGELLGWLARLHVAAGDPAATERWLALRAAASAETRAHLAHACALDPALDGPVATELAGAWVRESPRVAALARVVEAATGRAPTMDAGNRHRLRDALRTLEIPRHRCAACGFEARQAVWQCPSCRAWGSVRPWQAADR